MAISTSFSFLFFSFSLSSPIASENLQTNGNFSFDTNIQEIFEDNPLTYSTNKIFKIRNIFTCIMSIRLNSIYLIINSIGKMSFHLASASNVFFYCLLYLSIMSNYLWYTKKTPEMLHLFIKDLTLFNKKQNSSQIHKTPEVVKLVQKVRLVRRFIIMKIVLCASFDQERRTIEINFRKESKVCSVIRTFYSYFQLHMIVRIRMSSLQSETSLCLCLILSNFV